MTVVVDASVVVAALLDGGPDGVWATDIVVTHALVAPHLMAGEAANILRRAARAGDLTLDVASLAHADLLALRVEYLPYGPFGDRIWELGGNVTSYDAWYVAAAEALSAPLATLDRKLTRVPGPRCEFLTPGPP